MNAFKVIEFLQSTNDMAVVIRLFMAMFFGCLVGWERIVTRHSAGIKTFALVSLGAAVASALNVYLAYFPDVKGDIGRIPAQVVSGIGFLGAGTILVTGRKQIKGLTTAATLWVTACMGMAIGAGYMIVGVSCFLLIMLANIVLLQLSNAVEGKSRYMSLYVETDQDGGVKKLLSWIADNNYKISSMTKSKEKPLRPTDVALLIDMDFEKKQSHIKLITELNGLDFINYVEEV